ncbi:thioredoxin-like protein 1 [Aspergillus lentulus]|uniref:Thioredoxin-like protein 1 n=1 Tax=Aspergillus lentulus TaxID=293939 RepID=A0AAN4TB95_ASPLE|nr:thioredoxin-like protein 1 [Aspergillus lentulus]GAQ08063.1 thioredoxin-like protein 1 [Aspergillus lentulus]GFF52448.1 thioredoxin-like protein 1 [Aspergillus lentulus]GFF65862.1 thioredoxin-like protein 1 [Aspergillus lentulus]
MSAPVHISSKEQFSTLLSTSKFVVADFYADWCGPCKAIAPAYEQLAKQLSRPNRITFTKVNVDEQQDIAHAYGVTAMPTFIVFQQGRPISTVRGADPKALSDAVRKLADEANKNDTSSSGEASGDLSGGNGWIGAAVPKGYSDITDQHDPKGLELLNRDSDFGTAKTLFDPSKPSALSDNGKKKEGAPADWVESDTDEQLMLFIPFQSTIKVHSLQVTSLASPSEDDDEAPMRPKTIQLYTNRSHVLGFDEADDITPVQTVTIQPEDWDPKTATAKVDLRFVKFQNVTSLVVFFVDGDGDSEKLRVDRIRIFGEAGEKREMGKLEKIGDEPGE